MAKKKADQTPADVSPTPMVPIVINQHIPEQIQPIADQTPVEPLIIQEPEQDQQPVEPLPDRMTSTETIPQTNPDFQPEPFLLENENPGEQPEKELTFAEKVIQKARRRNGKRMVKVLADTITNLVNPVEKDDNPDRA